LLAAHPDVQDWVRGEIRQVLGGKDVKDVEFEEVYPRFVRCLAVLVSILRS